jgi:hypothetical protein
MGSKIKITNDDLKMIEFFTVERSSIDENDMKRINKEIILFRNRNKYNTNEENEKRNDKRYICVKESKITTLCDMCCKNELPEEDFQYVVKPKLMNVNKINKKYKANILIQNQDMDLQSENMLNIDNLILFNVGGLSTYEVSSLEKALKNKQFNMNLIYGSNQIYNHEEYLYYIRENFKGNSGIVKDMNPNININIDSKNNNKKIINKIVDEDNDSGLGLKSPQNTIDVLNEDQEQKINVNRISNINKNIIKNSSINNYEGNIGNSVVNSQDKNIRNTIESDYSDLK